MVEEWHVTREFYGSGYQSFLFKFDRSKQSNDKYLTNNIEVYDPKYLNNRYQHSDHECITLGSNDQGNSSIFITKNFKEGYTGESDTYTNPQLSHEKHFRVKRFEVWGFDEL